MQKSLVIHSLKGDRAFQRLRRGRAGHAKLLSIRWLPSKKGQVQVGIVVSKKVGKAVVRNRVRRRLHEAFRALLRESPLVATGLHQRLPSFSLVIIARPSAAKTNYWQLKHSLELALKKAKLLV